jgi:hypothetical protein
MTSSRTRSTGTCASPSHISQPSRGAGRPQAVLRQEPGPQQARVAVVPDDEDTGGGREVATRHGWFGAASTGFNRGTVFSCRPGAGKREPVNASRAADSRRGICHGAPGGAEDTRE